MDNDTLIKVENVSKKFSINLKRSLAYGTIDVARSFIGFPTDQTKLRKSEFWAVKDIDLELKRGKVLGIVGKNGSGKSTLLRLINGIYPPDKGKIMVKGRIGALIAVGAGFHPHMTGRENIYLNGTILGMSKAEIKAKIDDIIAFAEIDKFLDAPVSTYSSGMRVRLGFSIAIHSSPEILLADEILAVGDLQFVLKCYRKIAEYRNNGGSIILVSHTMQMMRNTCDDALWMDEGKALKYGDVFSVVDAYEDYMMNKDLNSLGVKGNRITNDTDTVIDKVEFTGKTDKFPKFEVGEKFSLNIHYSLRREVQKPIFSLGVRNAEDISAIASYSIYDGNMKLDKLDGVGTINFEIENLYLKPGNYYVTVTFAEKNLENLLDWHDKMYQFTVLSNHNNSHGLLQLPVKWSKN